jgi:hypothetical protein
MERFPSFIKKIFGLQEEVTPNTPPPQEKIRLSPYAQQVRANAYHEGVPSSTGAIPLSPEDQKNTNTSLWVNKAVNNDLPTSASTPK